MNDYKNFKQFWNGVEITIHNFHNKKTNAIQIANNNFCNNQKMLLKELEDSAKQSFNDMHTVTSIFQNALKVALREAPLAYVMNEDYKALLIEDYRKVLLETLGLDFDYQIKNNELETVS